MSLKRSTLETLLQGVENKDDIINQIMSEHGKSINELKSEVETLKGQILDKTKEYNELVEKTKDYDTMKQSNEDLNNQITAYKSKEENQQYFSVLKELGYNEEFIDESIFNKIEKGENIDTFKTNATKFLQEKPMYKAEGLTYRGGTNPSNVQTGGDKQIITDFTGMSDAEVYAALKENAKIENR